MDENLNDFFQHLEYLGCTNEYDDETKWAEVNHPIRDFQIFCGGERNLFHRVAIPIKEKLSTKKSDEIIRFMNYFNSESLLCSSFYTNNMVVCSSNYIGEYNKNTYGAFIEYFIKDIDGWIEEIFEKFKTEIV